MKEIKSKVVVFCDGEDDWNYFKSDFKNIEFTNLEIFQSPSAFEETFDIFMFDWGGMSIGNSILQSFIRYLYKMAEENPNKDFILLSKFTNESYNDLLNGQHEKLFNIYTTEEWIKTI